MLMFMLFFTIFVGVTIALYQVYETNFNINFGNDKKLSAADQRCLKKLSKRAKSLTDTSSYSNFDEMVNKIFGPKFDSNIVLAAFANESEGAYAIPLLRRKDRLRFNGAKNDIHRGDVTVRHLPFWKTLLPSVDARGFWVTLIILNCFLIQLLGAMSIYTLNYEISSSFLIWLNDPLVVVLVIYTLIFITYVISKFDLYMHDLYQLSKLFNCRTVGESSLTLKET